MAVVPKEQRAEALRARPMPPQSGPRPLITCANAQDYPPPSLRHYFEDERGPGSAPYIWFTQMMGWDWQSETSLPLVEWAYDNARKRWRRLLPDVRANELERERKRVREKGSKNPPVDQKRKQEQSLLSVLDVFARAKKRRGCTLM